MRRSGSYSITVLELAVGGRNRVLLAAPPHRHRKLRAPSTTAPKPARWGQPSPNRRCWRACPGGSGQHRGRRSGPPAPWMNSSTLLRCFFRPFANTTRSSAVGEVTGNRGWIWPEFVKGLTPWTPEVPAPVVGPCDTKFNPVIRVTVSASSAPPPWWGFRRRAVCPRRP